MPLQKLPVVGLDDVNHRRRARETINQVLDHSFDDSRVQTTAEKLAGITPVNTAFAPGDVRRYGAKGDGSTDDTQAIQAAIDSMRATPNGIVTLPSNNPSAYFKTTASLVVIGPIKIRGAGVDATTIISTGLAAGTFVLDFNCLAANLVENIEISGLTLRTSDVVANALRLKNASYVTVKDVRFYNVVHGCIIDGTRCFSLFFEQVTGYSITNSTFRYEATFAGGGHFTFNGCTFTGTNPFVVLSGAVLDNLAFFGCNWEQAISIGLSITGTVAGVGVFGCRTEGGDTTDFNFRPTGAAEYVSGIAIQGCVFGSSDSAGSYRINIGGDAGQVRGFNISGNVVTHSTGTFGSVLVRLNGDGESGVVSGNQIQGTNATGAGAINVTRDGVVVYSNENLTGKLGESWGTYVNSATYDPPSLADGAGTTTTVTATGAALGDHARASFSLDLQGITVTAWVSAANTVSVRFQNESGGVLDLASGTLRVQVFKA